MIFGVCVFLLDRVGPMLTLKLCLRTAHGFPISDAGATALGLKFAIMFVLRLNRRTLRPVPRFPRRIVHHIASEVDGSNLRPARQFGLTYRASCKNI